MGMPDAPWRFKPLMPSPSYQGLLITPMTKTAATVLEMLTGSLFSQGCMLARRMPKAVPKRALAYPTKSACPP